MLSYVKSFFKKRWRKCECADACIKQKQIQR